MLAVCLHLYIRLCLTFTSLSETDCNQSKLVTDEIAIVTVTQRLRLFSTIYLQLVAETKINK